jgi:putative transposase
VVLTVNLAKHESCPIVVSFYVALVLPDSGKLHLEILALRHQLAVLQRRTPKRATLRTADRVLWGMLSRVWAE